MPEDRLHALDELAGELVRLRAPTAADLDAFLVFDGDTDGARRRGQTQLPRSPERAAAWIADLVQKPYDADQGLFVVEGLAGGMVGTISVTQASARHGRFTYGVGIGAAHRGNGYGPEAVQLLLRLYFGELRYQKCETTVYAFNETSIRMHERLGFQVEGRRRRAVFTKGAHHDEVLLGITAEEFAATEGPG